MPGPLCEPDIIHIVKRSAELYSLPAKEFRLFQLRWEPYQVKETKYELEYEEPIGRSSAYLQTEIRTWDAYEFVEIQNVSRSRHICPSPWYMDSPVAKKLSWV